MKTATKENIEEEIKHIECIYPSINMFDEPRERLAGKILRLLNSSFVIETARLLDIIEQFKKDNKRWKDALESLTPGGSEFVDDPERCADFVRDKINRMWNTIKKDIKRIRELEAALADKETAYETE